MGAGGRESTLVAENFGADRERSTVGRVEGEVGAVRSIRIEPQSQGDALQDLGQRVREAVIWAVIGSTWSAARTTTLPRS